MYLLITLLENPNEPAAIEEYKNRAKVIRDEYGAKLILRQDVQERLLGDFAEESIRILEFPSIEHVKGWLTDSRYLEILPLRDRGYHKVTITVLSDPT